MLIDAVKSRRLAKFIITSYWLLVAVLTQAATISVDADCSLANAIRSANGDAQINPLNSCEAGDTGADTIMLTADITLSDALPTITTVISINGNGHFISGDDSRRILNISGSNANASLDNVTLKDGRASSGAAISQTNGATLSISNSTFQSNEATSAGTGGGAINHNSSGSLSVSNTIFLDNRAAERGAGIRMAGGGGLTLTNSTFTNNRAALVGGALYLFSNGATYNVSGSSFNRNEANGQSTANFGVGGAIAVTRGMLNVYNSTFFDNKSDGAGAAVWVGRNDGANLYHVTMVGNRSNYSDAGAAFNFEGTLRMYNSIIYNTLDRDTDNRAKDCHNLSGTLVSTNNWIQDGACSAAYSGDPGLAASATGAPAYYELLITSNAINSAPDDANCPATDQRGVTRPQGAACDLGAFELEAERIPTRPTVDFAYNVSQRTVSFDASAAGAGALSYAWDFGDGGTSSEEDPSHTYASAGTYQVSLTVSNFVGDTSVTKSVPVERIAPTADFTYTVSERTVTFDATATGLGALSYAWDFGDGLTSSAVDPAHTYTSDGSYTVRLTVSNTDGEAVVTRDVVIGTYTAFRIGTVQHQTVSVKQETVSVAGSSPSTGELLQQRTGIRLWALHGLDSGVEFQLVDQAGVANDEVIAMGFLDAVDVWSYVSQGVEVCFPQTGAIVFLDASTSPRSIQKIRSYTDNGYTCAFLKRAGTVVLVAGTAPAPDVREADNLDQAEQLTNCMVTTTNIVNFRASPGGFIKRLIPSAATLSATGALGELVPRRLSRR